MAREKCSHCETPPPLRHCEEPQATKQSTRSTTHEAPPDEDPPNKVLKKKHLQATDDLSDAATTVPDDDGLSTIDDDEWDDGNDGNEWDDGDDGND